MCSLELRFHSLFVHPSYIMADQNVNKLGIASAVLKAGMFLHCRSSWGRILAPNNL
jgi:hypothetical protein